MVWLAVIFFCVSEDDCRFWYKETLRPLECEKALADATRVMNLQQIPVVYGNCLIIKGSST